MIFNTSPAWIWSFAVDSLIRVDLKFLEKSTELFSKAQQRKEHSTPCDAIKATWRDWEKGFYLFFKFISTEWTNQFIVHRQMTPVGVSKKVFSKKFFNDSSEVFPNFFSKIFHSMHHRVFIGFQSIDQLFVHSFICFSLPTSLLITVESSRSFH